MKNIELIDRRFNDLLTVANQVLATRRSPPANVSGDDRVDHDKAQEFATSSSQFLGSLFGRDSEYYQRFQKAFKYAGYYSDMSQALAILRAAHNDYTKGYLVEAKSLIRAEVFDDILEQAEHLFKEGYHPAAAVLAGCVIEDSLRKMCERNGITIGSKPKLDSMNAELAKKGVYNTLVQKRLTWIADIRNKAAHGQWSEFSAADVESMLHQVRDFVTDYSA